MGHDALVRRAADGALVRRDFDSQLSIPKPPYGLSLMRDPARREGRCAVVLAVGGGLAK